MTDEHICPLCKAPRTSLHACTKPVAYKKVLVLQEKLAADGINADFDTALKMLVAEAAEKIMTRRVDTSRV